MSNKNLRSQFIDLDDRPLNISCLLCESEYNLPKNQNEFLVHLLEEHHLVIGDVDKIASLKSYIRYWRIKFKEKSLSEFCTTLVNDETKKSYYLLSDCLREDKVLREEIQLAKLDWILLEQAKERSDTSFQKGCLFCKTTISGSCIEFVKHLNQKHNLLLGKPDNLVFINELLNKIEKSLENLICIFCEKKFKDRNVLKEHMRKKLHKRINPNNKEYDKYYIQNYSISPTKNIDRTESKVPKSEDSLDNERNDEDAEWSDWVNNSTNVYCLFCKYLNEDFIQILNHLKDEHNFNFECITKDFNFYQKVKIVNYLRKKKSTKNCIFCDIKFENETELIIHMNKENHFKLPNKRFWDIPEYYFPLQEDDAFLYSLDTNSEEEDY